MKDKTIKVSIIVPVYNTEECLHKTIQSIINQNINEIEIICINDGSTDNSAQIIQEYAKIDNRINYIFQENQGLSVARNNGIAIAKGEYIGFVDSDDWIDSDFYEKLYNSAKRHNADIACAGIQYEYMENKVSRTILKIKKEKLGESTRKKYILASIPKCCYVWNKIYRAELFKQEENLLFEPGVYFEDIEFTHKILHYSKKLVTTADSNYHYRCRAESIMYMKNAKRNIDSFNAHVKAIKFIQKKGINIKSYNDYPWLSMKEYKIFKFPLLQVKKYLNHKTFYLFSIFPILNTTTHHASALPNN